MSCKHFLAVNTCQVCRPEPDQGYIAELNHEGDTKYTWDRKNPRECEAAHEHFEAMRAKGFLIFKVKRRLGFECKGRGKLVEQFDPKDEGYVYVAGKNGDPPYRQPAPSPVPAEVARKFDPKEDYVATPPVVGG